MEIFGIGKSYRYQTQQYHDAYNKKSLGNAFVQ